MIPLLIRNYIAEAAVTANRIVKIGSSDGRVLHGASEADVPVGVVNEIGADLGARTDIIHYGIADVKLGGTIARGEFVTSGAAGVGVKLTDTMLQSGACGSLGVALISGVSGDIIPVLLSPQKVSKFDAVNASAAEINKLDGAPLDASFVIGAEAANVINVAIQLRDADGADLAVRGNVKAYLSDDANGDSIVATAPDGGVAIGTDGLAIPLVASKAFLLTSESDGDIDINITHAAGAKTAYLILVLPNGKLKASTAITFA